MSSAPRGSRSTSRAPGSPASTTRASLRSGRSWIARSPTSAVLDVSVRRTVHRGGRRRRHDADVIELGELAAAAAAIRNADITAEFCTPARSSRRHAGSQISGPSSPSTSRLCSARPRRRIEARASRTNGAAARRAAGDQGQLPDPRPAHHARTEGAGGFHARHGSRPGHRRRATPAGSSSARTTSSRCRTGSQATTTRMGRRSTRTGAGMSQAARRAAQPPRSPRASFRRRSAETRSASIRIPAALHRRGRLQADDRSVATRRCRAGVPHARHHRTPRPVRRGRRADRPGPRRRARPHRCERLSRGATRLRPPASPPPRGRGDRAPFRETSSTPRAAGAEVLGDRPRRRLLRTRRARRLEPLPARDACGRLRIPPGERLPGHVRRHLQRSQAAASRRVERHVVILDAPGRLLRGDSPRRSRWTARDCSSVTGTPSRAMASMR